MEPNGKLLYYKLEGSEEQQTDSSSHIEANNPSARSRWISYEKNTSRAMLWVIGKVQYFQLLYYMQQFWI